MVTVTQGSNECHQGNGLSCDGSCTLREGSRQSIRSHGQIHSTVTTVVGACCTMFMCVAFSTCADQKAQVILTQKFTSRNLCSRCTSWDAPSPAQSKIMPQSLRRLPKTEHVIIHDNPCAHFWGPCHPPTAESPWEPSQRFSTKIDTAFLSQE